MKELKRAIINAINLNATQWLASKIYKIEVIQSSMDEEIGNGEMRIYVKVKKYKP
jgi:hypothetical protein